MLTYTACQALIGGLGAKKIDHNTLLVRTGPTQYEVQLHGNAIIRVFADGNAELSSCGFKTKTTLARLRKFGRPIRTHKGKWYVDVGEEYTCELEFEDGMRVTCGF